MRKMIIHQLISGVVLLLFVSGIAVAQSVDKEKYTVKLLGNNSNAWGIYQQTKPAAIYSEKTNKTYIAHHGPYDDAYILFYDHETGRTSRDYLIGKNKLPVTDKHSPPVLTIDNDGYIHAFWGAHNNKIQYSKTKKPYDIKKWKHTTEIDELGATYLFPFYYEKKDALYVMLRASDLQEEDSHTHNYPGHEYGTLIRSGDGGKNWEDIGPIVNLTDHPAEDVDFYQGDLTLDGDKVHFTWGITYGVGHDDVRADIYHAYLDLSDGTIYNVEGDYTASNDIITWQEHDKFLVYKKDHVMHSNHYVDEDEIYIVSNQYFPKENSWGYVLSTWNGNKWETEDTGARTNNIRHGSSVRKRPDGSIEIFAVAGREEDPAVKWSYSDGGSNLERAIAQGDDLRLLKKQNEGQFSETVLMKKESYLPQGIHDIQIPRNADERLVLVACVATADYGHKNLNLWGIGADALKSATIHEYQQSAAFSKQALFDYPGIDITLKELLEPQGDFSSLEGNQWYPLEIPSNYRAQNAKGVILEIEWSTLATMENSGEFVELRLRDNDTGRIADWISRIQTDNATVQRFYEHKVEVPLGREGIAFSISDPEKAKRLKVTLRGFYY